MATGFPTRETLAVQDGKFTQPWYLFFRNVFTGMGGGTVGTLYGSGVPNNSFGADGQFYMRSDGTVGSNIYKKTSGTWSAIL